MKRILSPALGVLFLIWVAAEPAQARSLPEFAPLVEKQVAVVVNISATRASEKRKAPVLRGGRDSQVPDWLRRFNPKSDSDQDDDQDDDDDRALGSGLVISQDGYILTNAHVVEGSSEILVRFVDKHEYLARLVGLDQRSDIALLKINASGLVTARLGNPSKLRVGDWVLAIGSPFGFESSVTAGIVSAKGRSLPDEVIVPFIQTDVAINPGNSGGPLFNMNGEVVGINSQIYSQTGGFMGLSFAIPIDVAMNVQAQLKQSGHVRRGRIGVLVQDITQDMAESFGLKQPVGALVSKVEPGGPAALGKLQVGDIILNFDGSDVADSTSLPRIVGACPPGRTVLLKFWRDGRILQTHLLIAQFPEEQQVYRSQRERMPHGANQLGLVTRNLGHDQARQLSLAHGASIREVAGAAARAELRQGDVVIAVVQRGRTTDVSSADQFDRLVNGLTPGAAVTLQVRRGDTLSFVGMRVPAN